MILNIYTLFDKDAETFNQATYIANNDKVAKRALKNSIEKDPTLRKAAKNYELHYLAQFDNEAGIVGNGTTRKVCELTDLVAELDSDLLGMPTAPAPELATPAASNE